jgi:hypothetical protein
MERRRREASSRWWCFNVIAAVLTGLGTLGWTGALEGTPLAPMQLYAWPLIGLGITFGLPPALHRIRDRRAGSRSGCGAGAWRRRRSLVRS